MSMMLKIYKAGTVANDSNIRYSAEKWTFSDVYMGEQRITFDAISPFVIEWEVGDFCIFRGQQYTLNYVPSCRQTGRPYESGDAFTYEAVVLNSASDELTRCIILDVVPTTGDYDQYEGTNYTGSAIFDLHCGETIWTDGQGVTHVYAPVHTLADRIKANLDRLYPSLGWQILVKDDACHSDDYTLNFNNWTAAQALAEVHNTFKCDYAVIGRTIYIGYSMPELTSSQEGPDDEEDPESVFYFGYGKGYPTIENGGGTALFEIKKIANPNQNIITRLRAYGSTKNMPYRYYMQRYDLPQTMFVHNLQLPDTFLPYSAESDPEHKYTRYKVDGNAERGDAYRHVLGETNDAYIDKGDDAAACKEGIREGVGAWDGSNPDLEEIYPTIQGVMYEDLRLNDVPDVFGVTGNEAYKSEGRANPYYQNEERIDEVLSVDEDCNIGDGIIPLSELEGREEKILAEAEGGPYENDIHNYNKFDIPEFLLGEIDDVQYAGNYMLSPTLKNVFLHGYFSLPNVNVSYGLSYKIRITQTPIDGGIETKIAEYNSEPVTTKTESTIELKEVIVPVVAIPDTIEEAEGKKPKVKQIHVTQACKIKVYFKVLPSATYSDNKTATFSYELKSDTTDEARLIWSPVAGESIADSTFHIYLKELGFDLSEYREKALEETQQISMKTGNCVGRTFDIQSVEAYEDPVTKKMGWKVELQRDTDDTIHVCYPNSQNTLEPGDRFVLLGIELPDAYIKAAELRLLRAATDYLADNCDTKYTHEPSLNNIYLQQNYEKCLNEGHEEKSIFWRLYAGLKFPFKGIPESDSDETPLPEINITISQVEIKMGDDDTPNVTIQLNDDVEQTTLQKLTVSVDRLYNAVGGYSASGIAGSMSSTFYDILRTEGARRFLAKDRRDTAAGEITFQAGARFGDTSYISPNGDARLNGEVRVGENPSDSLLDGSGTIIDDGRVQTTDMEVRGTLKVLDLVASQIHALDGYYYFSDTMKIARVEDTTDDSDSDSDSDSSSGEILTARIYFEKEYENDFLKFYVGDYLLSVRANLEDTTTERETSESGNTIRDIATESWVRVTDTSDGMADELWCDVQILAPNNVPQAGAYVARRGNASEQSGRTSSWCISVEEGRITYYINQTDNETHDYNYGVVVGKLPDIAPVRSAKAVGDVGVYAKYLLAQNLITVRWAGNVQYITEDKDEWNATDAANGEYYYSSQYDASTNVTTIARTKVTHNGCTWICVGNDEGLEYTTKEPTIQNSAQWSLLSGGDVVTSEETYYATTATDDIDDSDSLDDEVDGGGVSLGDNSVTWYANQSDCEYDALFPYMWKKTIIKTIANPSGTETIELIGVYGETGLNCHVTTEQETLFLSVNNSGHLDEEISEVVGVHLWLDEEEIEICPISVGGDAITVVNDDELIAEGIEVAIELDSSGYALDITVPTTTTFNPSVPKPIEIRVNGKATIGGKEYDYTRLYTLNLVGVLAGTNGADSVTYEIKANADIVHKAADGTATPYGVTFTFIKHVGASVEVISITSNNAKVIVDGVEKPASTNLYAPNSYVTIQWLDGNNVLGEKTVRVVSDGETPVNIELSTQEIFVPVEDGKIQDGGTVRVQYRTVKGSVVQQTIETFFRVISSTITYHGTYSGYLSVDFTHVESQYVEISYTYDADMSGTDWAEVTLTFNNGMVRVVKVYPNVSGMSAVGMDALNVSLSQDTYRIPIYDPRTKNTTTGNWNPIITREYADLVADVSAMRGTSQVMVTLSNASIVYYKNGDVYNPQAYLTAEIINNGQSVKVHVNPNVNVEKGNNDTISAKVSITYHLGGVTYSGLSIAVFTDLSVAQVSYEKKVNEEFVVGTLGGQKTISPNSLSLVYYRHADDTTQVLDSDAMRRLYMDESKTNLIEIHTWNGSSVVTNTISLIGLGNTFGLTTYATTIESPITITYSPIDAEPIVNQLEVKKNGADGSRGFPGCITRLHQNVLKAGMTYRNDSFATSAGENENGMFYVDYVAVLDIGRETSPVSGYEVFVVSTEHPTITIEGEDDIDLTTHLNELVTFMESKGFERVTSAMPSAWFTTLIAQNANVQMLSGAAITMLNSQQQITAGIANGEGAQGEAITGYHFWSGGATPQESNFSVDKNGKLRATGAEIEGSGTFDGVVKAQVFYSPTKEVTDTYNIGMQFILKDYASFFTLYNGDIDNTPTIYLPPASEYNGLELGFYYPHPLTRVPFYSFYVGTLTVDKILHHVNGSDLTDFFYSFVMPMDEVVRLKSIPIGSGEYAWIVIQGNPTEWR